jgi:hypothetical protein
MSHRHNKNKGKEIKKVEREVGEVEKKVDEAIKLDKEILASRELTSLKLVQNQKGATEMPTNNSIVAGTTGNFSAVPGGGVFPPGASVNFTQDDPNAGEVILTPGAPDAQGNPTVNAAVIAGAKATSFNLGASVTRTDGTVITAPPLAVAITPAAQTELTSLSLVQNS